MGSKEWPPCTPSQENKSTQWNQNKPANPPSKTKINSEEPNKNQQTKPNRSGNGLQQIQQEQGSGFQKNPQLSPANQQLNKQKQQQNLASKSRARISKPRLPPK